MSYSEYRDWKSYEKMELEGLIETKEELQRQLLAINDDISKLLGKKVEQAVYFRALNEKTQCRKCKLITSLVRHQLCYSCC